MLEKNETKINAFFEDFKEVEIGKGLDIATGRGEFIAFLRNIFSNISEFTGIDTHSRILEIAKKTFSDCDFRQMNAYQLDYPDSTFELVSISNSLHHLDEPTRVLKEMYRVLDKNGLLIIREMLSDNGQTNAQKSHIMVHHLSAEVDKLLGRVHNQTFSEEEVIKLESSMKFSSYKRITFDYTMPAEQVEKSKEQYINLIDAIIKPARETEVFKALHGRGEDIKNHISIHGFAPARTHFFVGTK